MLAVQAVAAALSLLEDGAFVAPPEVLEDCCKAVALGMGEGVIVPWELFPRAGQVFAALGWFNLHMALRRAYVLG